MARVIVFKMPFKTKHFNRNQKVWIQAITGAMAAKVTGKFRGKGRYVSARVSWDRADRGKYPIPKFNDVDVDDNFAQMHGLYVNSEICNE